MNIYNKQTANKAIWKTLHYRSTEWNHVETFLGPAAEASAVRIRRPRVAGQRACVNLVLDSSNLKF